MRIYKNITYDTDKSVIRDMQILSKPNVSVDEYRDAFYRLGKTLGEILNRKTGGRYGPIMLAVDTEKDMKQGRLDVA